MKRYAIFELKNALIKILKINHVNDDQAEILADTMLEADMRGVHTHGISIFPAYIKKIQTDYSLPKSYKPDGFDNDLARQIIATSKVAKIKFRLFNVALTFLALAICFVVTSIVVSQVLK